MADEIDALQEQAKAAREAREARQAREDWERLERLEIRDRMRIIRRVPVADAEEDGNGS